MTIDCERLIEALGDRGSDAGVSYRADLEPLAGPGAPVKPAVYQGGTYQLDNRWWGNPPEPVHAVVIDNAPSEANRLEAALSRYRDLLRLPLLELDLSSVGALPAHVKSSLTSLEFPHRHADAYLRDSLLAADRTRFVDSEIGRALAAASADKPQALLQWVPQSLLFGFWQAHRGKHGVQTKFARAMESEIVGYRPATVETRRLGLKGDPLNLSTDDPISFDADDPSKWVFVDGAKAGRSKSKDSLAEIGHGQVPVSGSDAPLGAVSFQAIEQRCTISFARLRTIETGAPATNAAARAVLVALGLVALEAAFGHGFTLRSGCDLRPMSSALTWRGADGDEEVWRLGLDAALGLFATTVERAADLGLPVGSGWDSEPVRLVPNDSLAEAIRSTFGLQSA
jgi:CRISPR-associated protein Csb1